MHGVDLYRVRVERVEERFRAAAVRARAIARSGRRAERAEEPFLA